jgi:IS30 family transposase
MIEDQVGVGVSHETIYNYIYSHWKRRVKFYQCLRRKHISRQKKGDRRSCLDEAMLIKNRTNGY